MAVGDIINIRLGGATTYVPSSGVEIVVMRVFYGYSAAEFGFQTSAGTCYTYRNAGAVQTYDFEAGARYGITNSAYFYESYSMGFSGIQTK